MVCIEAHTMNMKVVAPTLPSYISDRKVEPVEVPLDYYQGGAHRNPSWCHYYRRAGKIWTLNIHTLAIRVKVKKARKRKYNIKRPSSYCLIHNFKRMSGKIYICRFFNREKGLVAVNNPYRYKSVNLNWNSHV